MRYWKYNNLPYGEYSSCLQITLASVLSQLSSQIVPHVPLIQTSTRPKSLYLLSPFKRTSPCVQGAEIIYALKGTSQ